jgi:glucose-6-phosphate isomerase
VPRSVFDPGRNRGCFSVFTAAGLLPAALVGLDVVRLLEGASTMNDHFRTMPVGRNAVLDSVGVGRLWESWRQAAGVRGLRIWPRALQSVGRWYLELWEESFRQRIVGLSDRAQDPRLATGNPVAVPTQGMQRGVLWTNVIVEHCRCDPLGITQREPDTDGWNHSADPTHTELLETAIRETAQRDRQNGCLAVDLRLKRLNEHTLGQLLQMWLLASAIESCLGPPGDGEDSRRRQSPQDFGAGFLYCP